MRDRLDIPVYPFNFPLFRGALFGVIRADVLRQTHLHRSYNGSDKVLLAQLRACPRRMIAYAPGRPEACEPVIQPSG